MKSRHVEIAKWFAPESDGSGNLYIDWPAAHRQAGVDHIEWLLKQPKHLCQLLVESKRNDPYHYLVAEFYDDSTLTHYHLMWAK